MSQFVVMLCTAYSQATAVSTSSVRQSEAATVSNAAVVKSDAVIETVDTMSLPDVNTALPTVCSSASIASSSGTTDNECESFCLLSSCSYFVPVYSHYSLITHVILFLFFIVYWLNLFCSVVNHILVSY